MLDVHAPHQSPFGVRDFFIHLLTITAGLLIALGLEAAVEAMHHHHQRIEAEQTIHRELEENREKLISMQPGIATEFKNLSNVLAYLEARRDGKPIPGKGLALGFSESPLKDTAWQTAADTGVLAYIDYDRVQDLAGAYQEQHLFQAAEERALEHLENLKPYLANVTSPDQISQADMVEAIPDVRHVIADIAAMHDISCGTLVSYDAALKTKTDISQYCVVPH